MIPLAGLSYIYNPILSKAITLNISHAIRNAVGEIITLVVCKKSIDNVFLRTFFKGTNDIVIFENNIILPCNVFNKNVVALLNGMIFI